jgi:hypothetical protein
MAVAKLGYLQTIVLAIGLLGFAVAFVVQCRLRHHVSPDRVRDLLHTPSELYRNSVPPKRVLDERGLQLHRLMVAGGMLFVAACAVLVIFTEALPW